MTSNTHNNFSGEARLLSLIHHQLPRPAVVFSTREGCLADAGLMCKGHTALPLQFKTTQCEVTRKFKFHKTNRNLTAAALSVRKTACPGSAARRAPRRADGSHRLLYMPLSNFVERRERDRRWAFYQHTHSIQGTGGSGVPQSWGRGGAKGSLTAALLFWAPVLTAHPRLP